MTAELGSHDQPPPPGATAPTRWGPGHRLRHAVSTRAFQWLARRKVITNRPGEQFRIVEHTLRLPGLPVDLDGLRVAHLSDLHVGRLLRPDHLRPIVDAVNLARPDLIANTGDMLDYSNRYLGEVVDAIARLDAPLGVYSVLGNHDHRDNAAAVARAFQRRGLNLLVNQAAYVHARRHALAVAGIDWAENDHELRRLVHRACGGLHGDDLRLLLAHHPHALDPAQHHGVDLVLSGHTHGGQFVFRKSRTHERESLGLGNLNFRYPQGHYQRGPTHLFVTNGLGSSFPLRFRCPPEVSLLTLRPGG